MALVTTTVNPLLEIFPVKRPGEPQVSQTAIPRSRVNSYAAAVVPALGAGDESRLVVTQYLPQNFVYVCQAMRLSLVSAATGLNSWEDVAPIFDRDVHNVAAAAGGNGFVAAGCLKTSDDSEVQYAAANWTRVYSPDNIDHLVLKPTSATGGFEVSLMDVTPTTPATTAYWFASFLMYDLEQEYAYGLNMPAPTLERS